MTIKELKATAKQLGINGYSSKSKAELEVLVATEQDKRIANKLVEEAALIVPTVAFGQKLDAPIYMKDKSINKGGNMNKRVTHADADAQIKIAMAALEGNGDVKTGEKITRADGVVVEKVITHEIAGHKFPKGMEVWQEVTEQLKVEVQQIPKVIYKYVPNTMMPVDGIRLNPVTVNGIYNCMITNETFKISTGNKWYQAVLDGRVKAAILEFSGDTEIKKKVVRAAVYKIAENGKAKRGAVEFLFSKTADQSKSVFFYGPRKELIKIIGADPSTKKPVNKIGMPTFSNNILELQSSDITVAKLMVVDPRIKNMGRNANDGACHWDNVKFYYETYVSEKDKAEGKKSKLMPMDEAQIRLSGWETNKEGKEVPLPVVKGDSWMPTFFGYAADFCAANGLELGDCHGAIDIESLKSNPRGYKHGDIMEVNMSSLVWANKVSEDGSGGNIGTQVTSLDADFAKGIMNEIRIGMGKDKLGDLVEPGLRAKGFIMKDLLAFKAKAVARCIRATGSMEDSPLQDIKCLTFSIPKDKEGNFIPWNQATEDDYYSPAYQSSFNQICARAWAYYTNDILRAKTSRVNGHFAAHPSLLLDKLEQKIYDATGELVNLAIVPNTKEFMADYDAHALVSLGRAPFVGPASVGEILPLRTDDNGEFILDPAKLRAKVGKLVTTTRSAIMVSSKGIQKKDGTWLTSFIESLTGDFDGDGYILVFSNVVAAPVYRLAKVMPGVEAEGSKPVPLNDEEFLDALCEAYDTQIESQKAIGMMDNYRKLLYAQRRVMTGKIVKINGVDRKCVPIPASIGHEIGITCELLIQSKKHVLDNKSVSLEKTKMTKKYAPNGELPTGDDRPLQFLLLHNALGLTESDDQHINHEILLQTLCNIVNHYNKVGVHELDCYSELWKAMNGMKMTMVHEDSEYWRVQFLALWNKLQTIFFRPGMDTPNKVSEKTLGIITSMGDFLNGNGEERKDGEWSGFRYYANLYIGIKDNEERQTKYSELYKDIEQKIKNWLINICGEDEERKSVMLRLLAMYLGIIGFGIGVSEKGEQYSLPGRALWVLGSWKEGKAALQWVAKRIHPNNPFLKGVK